MSLFHPHSNYSFQSVYISSNTFILSECKYFISNPNSHSNSHVWISICLGGLVAEYLIFGKVSPRGSDNDFKDILEEINKIQSSSSFSSSSTITTTTFNSHKSFFNNTFQFIPSTALFHYFQSYFLQIKNAFNQYSPSNINSHSHNTHKDTTKLDEMFISDSIIEIIQQEFKVTLQILTENKEKLLKMSEFMNKQMDTIIHQSQIHSLLSLTNSSSLDFQSCSTKSE